MKIVREQRTIQEIVTMHMDDSHSQEERFSRAEQRIRILDERIEAEAREARKEAAQEAREDFYERTWANVNAKARVAERAREFDEEQKEAAERAGHMHEHREEMGSNETIHDPAISEDPDQ